MMNKKQDKSILLLEIGKAFAESCRKISEIKKVYIAFVMGKISLEEFREHRRIILEEPSG